MICLHEFTITIDPAGGEMPLDSAVFHSGLGVIFAVRGGTLYRFNATTGAKISTATQFNACGLSPASIAWDDLNDVLLCASWNDIRFTDAGATGQSRRYLYGITPATSVTAFTVDIKTSWAVPTDLTAGFQSMGIRELKYFNGTSYAMVTDFSAFPYMYPQIAKFDASVPAVAALTDPGEPGSNMAGFALDVDGGREVVWVCGTRNKECQGVNLSGAPVSVTISGAFYPLAVEWCKDNNKLYITDQLRYIRTYTDAGVASTVLDTGDATFNGIHIRYNPYDQKIYAAGYASNKVAVITQGAPDTIATKTGFDLPWDFVFTPTKSFCVQQGALGLKEII